MTNLSYMVLDILFSNAIQCFAERTSFVENIFMPPRQRKFSDFLSIFDGLILSAMKKPFAKKYLNRFRFNSALTKDGISLWQVVDQSDKRKRRKEAAYLVTTAFDFPIKTTCSIGRELERSNNYEQHYIKGVPVTIVASNGISFLIAVDGRRSLAKAKFTDTGETDKDILIAESSWKVTKEYNTEWRVAELDFKADLADIAKIESYL